MAYWGQGGNGTWKKLGGVGMPTKGWGSEDEP